MCLLKKMKNKPLIIWEKWSNPLINNSSINKEYNDVDDDDAYLDEDNHEFNNKTTNVVITPLGIIPFDELKDCDTIFNFWTGHTNFSISEIVAENIEGVDGVETLDIFTRYRFRIGIGKAFKDGEVMSNITDKVYSVLNQ